jgi:hypothetical protein
MRDEGCEGQGTRGWRGREGEKGGRRKEDAPAKDRFFQPEEVHPLVWKKPSTRSSLQEFCQVALVTTLKSGKF